MRGAVLLFSPDASVAFTAYLKTRLAAMAVFHLPLAIGLLAGIVLSLRQKRLALAILSLFTAAYLLIHAPVTGSGGRYCIPVFPLLIAISGCVVFGDSIASAAGERDVFSVRECELAGGFDDGAPGSGVSRCVTVCRRAG